MPVERGSLLGPYQIQFRLGGGGMGEVWRALDTRSGREVAIKVISEQAGYDPDLRSRFLSEAKASSALHHPNILEVYEVGESPAGPYIVMEYVDGGTVRSLLNDGPLPLAQAVDIAMQAADGVANAHGAGIVHRDLKPDNLMITSGGVVKILDFGLARSLRPEDAADGGRTAAGMIVGTAAYVSPEQLRGEKATERSDVFALGVRALRDGDGGEPLPAQQPDRDVQRDPPRRTAAARRESSRALRRSSRGRSIGPSRSAPRIVTRPRRISPRTCAAFTPSRTSGRPRRFYPKTRPPRLPATSPRSWWPAAWPRSCSERFSTSGAAVGSAAGSTLNR